ncbi:hypothetical protein J2S05_001922 [Alkalicoccobacillus murimartini]|uniref:Uncharacterized protein n=1 Tax=Alkalicoccobacillus murimartini TaxID=171685 RepID=A0ABT9YGX9_9BACI|nr:hypothetical protein [Alkalicoccobacillus murimartini]
MLDQLAMERLTARIRDWRLSKFLYSYNEVDETDMSTSFFILPFGW